MTGLEITALVVAGAAAGVINTVVGSGTLVTFSVLLAVGYPPVTANIINAAGVLPGSVSGAFGYRHQLPRDRRLLGMVVVVSLGGATLGGACLLMLPDRSFAPVAAVCILLACILMLLPARKGRPSAGEGGHPGRPTGRACAPGPTVTFGDAGQVIVMTRERDGAVWPHHLAGRGGLAGGMLVGAAYGGYFAAGIGVVLLAVLRATLPQASLHEVQALKMWAGTAINGTAVTLFILTGQLVWIPALLIGGGALLGGWAGAVIAQRLPQRVLRGVIVGVGVISAVNVMI